MKTLPPGWLAVTVGDLIHGIEAGKNFRCIERPPDPHERGVVKVSAVSWGKFLEEESKTVPANAQVDERARIAEGDLLISRANTLELVGACVHVGNFARTLFLSDKVLRLKANPEIRPWLHRYLTTPSARHSLGEASTGNQLSMRNISQIAISRLPVPLAPLDEQRRITAKLHALLVRIDACRDHLDRLPTIIKRFRQSVLAAATSGKLTEDWRAQRNLEMDTKDVGFEEDSVCVPQHWDVQALSDLIDPSRPLCYGVVQPGGEIEGGIRLIRVQDMYNGSVAANALRTISRDVDAQYRRSRVESGDLLVSVVGTIGRTAIVPRELVANIARAIARVACRSDVSAKWVNYWLSCQTVQWWLSRTSREVARKTLNLSDLGATKVAVPPHDEQEQIVKRAEALFLLADRLEARIASARVKVEALAPAALTKAFRGELVPQDPDDEPASVLLDRIRAEGDVRVGRRGCTSPQHKRPSPKVQQFSRLDPRQSRQDGE